MKYERVKQAVFIDRPNRFIAHGLLEGKVETVHVKNTGRCRELLLPGAKIWLSQAENPERKTRYDLIAVQKGERIVNIDSQAPNHLFRQWVEEGGFPEPVTEIRSEFRYGGSRFDFRLMSGEREILAEVKGVTLEEDGRAYFPDAPTQRGRKHLFELAEAAKKGTAACICFVVQMAGIASVSPNDRTDPDFGKALRYAAESGVAVYAFGCRVTGDSIDPDKPIDVIL